MDVWKRLPWAVLIPAVVFAGVATLLVLAPGPRSPLHYMVAGTLATTGALVCVFLRLAGAKIIRRRSRKKEPPPPEIVPSGYRIFGQL